MCVPLRRLMEVFDDGAKPSESELRALREQLYALAEVVVAACWEAGPEGGQRQHAQRLQSDGNAARTYCHMLPFPGGVPQEEQELFDERAGIMEYEAGLSRALAERLARIDIESGRTH